MTMRSGSRLAGRFALVFVTALAVLAVAWTVVAPRYGAAVSAAAQPLFRAVERPNVTVLSVEAGEVWAFRRVGEDRVAPFMFFDRYAFFAVVPLLALFLATPTLQWGRRVALAAGGVIALFAFHVFYVVVSVELSYSAAGLAAGGPREIAQLAVRVLWEASPIVIWLAFTIGVWRRAFAKLQALAPGGRNVLQPQRATGTEGPIAWTPREGRTE
jgi:hypothetical protein